MDLILFSLERFCVISLASNDFCVLLIVSYLSKNMDEVTRVHEDIMLDGWNDLVNTFLRFSFTDPDNLPGFLDGDCKNQLRNLENLYVRYGVMVLMTGDV